MSAKLILSLASLIFISLFLPSLSRAATCEEAGGHCALIGMRCWYGSLAGTCPALWKCCKNSGSSPINDPRFCNPTNSNSGIKTALGCLQTSNPKLLIDQIIRWAVGVGGGIAFIFIVYAGFLMATAAGDPKRIKAGQEIIVNVLGALALIVMAVVILNFIGVQILGLGGLGFNP
ncbi:MAG: hypothetical protein UX91_C0001G0128 [Candidatus Amesbacteria bacterium GW2011_GWB1_47_19]|nr:MAG: hypothetical protein UW51_C0001G0128 [Candidatus Amesbacteria bacterium GW2011_GWA1_44_24]KKU32140.1 MAG: hypothetical protein UX46_C0001G0127 [Candidatus Amesbacteria bacterium GW2011_GWC1_46_24]KKU67824.1 MAG: hypothetical protein UX91_C0001G0128 [Candidatus Amesbacteria bacterium GW2011_GWB1_47_19]OGD05013.1 MAG: hypothetical protein A2379_03875 [Candidatus Amesbacteria bacterium RIFOXYB1_FULL_47_13]HBC72424.1 hypothetical protein [Candidatus Amesbacteria bacterium]